MKKFKTIDPKEFRAWLEKEPAREFSDACGSGIASYCAMGRFCGGDNYHFAYFEDHWTGKFADSFDRFYTAGRTPTAADALRILDSLGL